MDKKRKKHLATLVWIERETPSNKFISSPLKEIDWNLAGDQIDFKAAVGTREPKYIYILPAEWIRSALPKSHRRDGAPTFRPCI